MRAQNGFEETFFDSQVNKCSKCLPNKPLTYTNSQLRKLILGLVSGVRLSNVNNSFLSDRMNEFIKFKNDRRMYWCCAFTKILFEDQKYLRAKCLNYWITHEIVLGESATTHDVDASHWLHHGGALCAANWTGPEISKARGERLVSGVGMLIDHSGGCSRPKERPQMFKKTKSYAEYSEFSILCFPSNT